MTGADGHADGQAVMRPVDAAGIGAAHTALPSHQAP